MCSAHNVRPRKTLTGKKLIKRMEILQLTCSDDDNAVGGQSAAAALDVHKLFHANVAAKARLVH